MEAAMGRYTLRAGRGRDPGWGIRAVACLVALLVTACGTEAGEPQGAGDGETGCLERFVPIEPNPFDGESAWFVIDSIRLGDQVEAEGFDLDCVNTPAGHWYLPSDGPGGVDNQFGELVDGVESLGLFDLSVDGDMQRSVDEGRSLIVFRLADVDDWEEDQGLVYLLVYGGVDTDADPSNSLTGNGRIWVAEESLADPDDIETAREVFVNGTLHDTAQADDRIDLGDFTASGPDLTLQLVVGASVATLPLREVHVVFDLETIPLGSPPLDGQLVRGLMGGAVPLRAAAEFIETVYPELPESPWEIDATTLRSIAAGQADLDLIPEGFTGAGCTVDSVQEDCEPGQYCRADPDRGGVTFCYEVDANPDAISVAFVFTAVSCDVVGIAPAE